MRLSLNYKMRVSTSPASKRDRETPQSAEVPSAAKATMIDVQTLLAGRSEVRLVHRGEEYRLRITRQGKLLLTK